MVGKFTVYSFRQSRKLCLQFTVIFLLLAFSFLFFAIPVSAQTPLPPAVSPTSPLYTDLLVHNMFHTFSCLAAGQSVIGQPCLTYQSGIPVLSSVNLSGGALGATTSLIGMLYLNPPVRTADYLASLGQGFGVVREANAQVGGSGAGVLSPIISLWQVSRNIAYLVMIIIFVVIGLMVMFRQRINPQTVITAQAALPGLVIGLIMITFSFFLAGLVSDMAFVGTNLVGAYFSSVTDKSQNLVDDLGDKNVLKIFTPFTKIVSLGKVYDALGSIWDDLEDPKTCRFCPWQMDPQKVLSTLSAFVILQLIMPFASMGGGIGQIISVGTLLFEQNIDAIALPTLAITFIAMAMLIYAMFKLLLRLINAYISIIFLTITAPFQFLAAALPGRQGIATKWILSMLANVLAFPAVLAVFYFVAYLLGPNLKDYCPPPSCPFVISERSKTEYNALVPVANAADTTLAGKETFPLFGGMSVEFINLLLAFGALVALPKIPDLVAKAIGGLSEAGQLIGQEIGGSTRAGQGYAGQFQQGTSGLAGQVGRLPSEKGLYPIVDDAGNITGWRRPNPNIPPEVMASGARPGTFARAKAGAGDFFGGARNFFGKFRR